MKWHVHVSEFWQGIAQTAAWGLCIAWITRTYSVATNIPQMPDLRDMDWDYAPEGNPSLTVIVPAKDEADNIAATLDALVVADWPALQIIAIDDRSTDGTGTIMDEYAARRPDRFSVIHITELPEGWLGKTFALAVGTDNSRSDYILFTDADVLFSPSILRRALAYAEATQADHLVVLPTMQVKSHGEGILLGFFQLFGTWASRLWRVEDAGSRRDVIGVGAFNFVRRTALEELGGWGPQRLVVLEDVTLGRRMKAAGMRQRVAFAPGFVLVHWAKGARGLMRVMTKNLFSAFNFRIWMVGIACAWIVLFCLAPIAMLAWWPTLPAGVLILCCVAATYSTMGAVSEIDPRYGWAYFAGAFAFMAAMARSMAVVLWRRGVVWRGTFYPLRELRSHNSPLRWDIEAARERRAKRRGMEE